MLINEKASSDDSWAIKRYHRSLRRWKGVLHGVKENGVLQNGERGVCVRVSVCVSVGLCVFGNVGICVSRRIFNYD